ncbi:hypothetical protein [Nitrospira sp. M1]
MKIGRAKARSFTLEDIQACLIYARRLVGHERFEPLPIQPTP